MKVSESQLGYARIIANTVREPFLVLDRNFRVLAANRSFYKQFQLLREETENRLIYDLGKGKWNIPRLRRLLETIITECESVEDYKIQISFEPSGEKILLINAHRIESETPENRMILLSIEDATEHRQTEESLQIERGRLAATLKSIPDELWITDALGNIIERSEGHIQYSLGKSNWPDVDTALQELELLNADGTRRPPGNAALPRALRGEITQKVPEMIRNLETGELRWREVSSSPIRDEKGSIIGAVAIARDITERKRAEEELQKSEQRFRALATAGFSVVYRMSPDWSEMWQLIGSDFLADSMEKNRDWLKLYIPEQERSRVLSTIDEAIHTRSIFELEHRVIQADGSIGWVHSRAVPLIDSNGVISEWFGAARDIAEVKKAEAALQLANKKFLGLFNNKIVGLAYCKTVFDSHNQAKDYTILDINPTYELLTGISRDQIISKKITEAAPGVSQELIDRHNRVALTGEEDRFELYEPVTDRWYEINVFSPEKGYFISLFSNISDRKRAEEELLKSEQRFRALATAGFSVVYRMSPDWGEMLQLRGAEFLADTVEPERNWLKRYIPPDEQPRVLEAINMAIRTRSLFELEHRVFNLDGSIAWTFSHAVPLFDRQGEIYEWFGAARDITVYKQAEQALIESERNLEVAQRITHVGSWNWNVETGEIICSAETYRIYGEEPFSFKVTKDIYLNYVHPEDRDSVKSLIADVQTIRTKELNMEFRIVRNDGEVRYIHSVGEIREYTTQGKPLLITGTGQDITERKLLEKKLEFERDFVTAVVQTSGALITVIKLDGTITRFNKACEDLTGYTEDEIIGGSVFDLFIPVEEREDANRVAERLFGGEKYVEHENHWITKNGDRRFIRWRNSILPDNNGHPELAIATGIDITDRKKAEEALLESEASLKRSQEIAHLGSWELDLVENRLVWSDEIYRIFGLQPQEFGATFEAFLENVHPDDREVVDSAYKTSVQEGRDSYEVELRVLIEATGEIRFVHEKCQHIRDANGKIIRSVGMVHDITDRKKVEVELRESQERFAAAFRSVQDALVISDPESDLIIEVNQTWISHWGYSAEQSIGHRSTELGIFTDVTDRDRAMQIIRKEGRLTDFEILLQTKSGEIRNAILFVEKLMLTQKALMLTIISDVTERKRAEEALQSRTKELEIANRDLESFSYSVSHDLRSPLTVIQGFINILLEEYGNKLDEHGRGIFNHITNASNKMASIMTDLLNLARISKEKMTCHEVDLNPIANSVVEELRQSEPQRIVQISIASKIPAHADPKLMTIALRNLIENAWKYTGKKSDARIDIGINSNGINNAVFIKDNGAGFDINFAHKIFRPFERLHSDSQFTGTGIGLAIVQRIIQRHGGRIWAESEIEKGTTFYFTLDCSA